MKRFLALLLAGVVMVTAFGCGKKDETTVATTAASTASSTVVEDHSNQERSTLTGMWVKKGTNEKRPVAVMLSNQPEAPDPYGSSKASVIYEAPAEDNYATRMMGIFENYEDIKKIGSIRSCRTYYVYFMLEFDAIYVHAGQAVFALPTLEQSFVDNLSTLNGNIWNEVFYQTTDLKVPHNTFTSGAGIIAGAEKLKYDLKHDKDYKGHYQFNEDDKNKIELTGGIDALYFEPGYYVNKPVFEYNAKDGLYYRYQTKQGKEYKQTDPDTNEQLAVTNIIVQNCKFGTYEDTHYWNINTTSGGKGYYITNGKAIEITWKKDSEYGVTHYYDSKGKEITLNQGKTWVCIINNDNADNVYIGKTRSSEATTKKS